jgi:adenylate kinase
MTHISTGEILRDAVARLTPLGRKAKPFMDQGHFVPDDLVNDMVAERFRAPDRPTSFLMDGYPRTLPQAVSFDQALAQQFLGLDAVLLFEVDDAEILRRLRQRRISDQRSDDDEATVLRRLEVHRASTADVVEYYRSKGLLREVNGVGPVDEITQTILAVLPSLGVGAG